MSTYLFARWNAPLILSPYDVKENHLSTWEPAYCHVWESGYQFDWSGFFGIKSDTEVMILYERMGGKK